MQVEDIETKLDLLIDMYREDRVLSAGSGGSGTTGGAGPTGRNQAMMSWMPTSYATGSDVTTNNDNGEGQTAFVVDPTDTGNGTVGQCLVTPAGMDMAQDSDPSTPLTPSTSAGLNQWSEDGSALLSAGEFYQTGRNPARPMLRNLSDLGPRIKKRVTYGSAGASATTVSISSSALNQQPSTADLSRRSGAVRSSISGPRHQPSIVNEEDEENGGNTNCNSSGASASDNDGGGNGHTETADSGSTCASTTSVASSLLSLQLNAPPPVLVTDWNDKNGKTPVFDSDNLTYTADSRTSKKRSKFNLTK